MANKGGSAGPPTPGSPAAPVELSGNLEASLRRALALAHQQWHDSATVHADLHGLSRALTADDDLQVENPISDGRQDAKPSPEFQRVIARAATQVQSTHQAGVTGAHVLVAMIDQHDSHAAGLLREYGITRYDATAISATRSPSRFRVSLQWRQEPDHPAALQQPPGLLAKVQLLNDDYTPMEFVVDVLQRSFGMDHETAIRIMLEIHHQGAGTCGIYPNDIAATKVTEVLEFARQHGHPLLCVLESRSSA